MAWFQDIQDVPMLAGHSWDRTPAETPLGSIADPGCHPWQPWPAARDLGPRQLWAAPKAGDFDGSRMGFDEDVMGIQWNRASGHDMS